MKPIFLVISITLFSTSVIAQSDTIKTATDYSFIIQDSPSQLFTMRQFNQNYLSAYRLFARGLNKATVNSKVSDLIQLGMQAFFLIPLTHEEGHRSILTVNNIGSISQPFFNLKGAAYVVGVRDETLMNLRDEDLPTYIRLHTAGIESDYMLTNRIESIGSFNFDKFDNYKWEYWARKFAILQYYMIGLLKYDVDLEEEPDELERDIVGVDTYGAARHLFRPTMGFYRYTRFGDLTSEEKKFIDRMGYRSFLNLLNPLIIGIRNIHLTDNVDINAGLGYTLAPFGDFIDENVWLQFRNLNLKFYARQFQNKDNWFNGFGLEIHEYHLGNSLSISLAGHFWEQPLDLNFNTSNSFTGGAIDTDFKYFFISKHETWLKAISLNLGLRYKTRGFLPEEVYLDENFGVRIGTSIRL
jgi:hypothetical protein